MHETQTVTNSPPIVLANLPLPLTSFIGRERELAHVEQLLAAHRLVTLTGAGGSGKTRLALQTCSEVARLCLYDDGICWVELAPLADPALVPQAIAQALGVSEQASRTLTGALVDYFREKQFLLVLDNCEHLVESCAQVASDLLTHCPQLKIMATSREALNIEGEQVWVVPPLSLPAPSASDFSESDAVRLFIARASGIQSDFTMNGRNAASVARICWRLDGIPLAIELAAARVKVLSVEQIAVRLDDTIRLLTVGKRTAPQRHQTLRKTMDWSHDLLAKLEQALFRRLSVFAGGFTLEAAAAICSDDTVVADELLDLLTLLVDKSLVVKQEQGSEVRFRLLEPIRQYAREKLLEASEGEITSQRHLNFFLNLAEEAQPKLIGVEQMTWVKRLDDDLDNLRAAIAWARTRGEAEKGLRLVNALQWFWYWRGYWHEAKASLADLVVRSEVTPVTPQWTRLHAHALFLEAFFTNELDGGEVAKPLLIEAIKLSQSVDDKCTIAETLLLLAVIASGRGDHAVCQVHIEQSLALGRAMGDTHLIARVLMQRGNWVWLRGEVNQARADVEEALQSYRVLGDQIGIAASLSQLGAIAFNQGDYAAARKLNEESLTVARELGLKREMAVAVQRLGQALAAEGEYTTAQALYEQNLALRRNLGERSNVAHILWLMSNLKRLIGDLSTARSLAEESLQMARELDEPLLEAHALASLGKLALAECDYVNARARFEESLLCRQRITNKLDMPAALQDLADLAFCQGDLALASDYYEKTLSISREIGNQASMSVALRMLGYIELYHGDLTRASQRFTDGLRLNQQRSFRLGMIRHLPAFAALALAQGDVQRAARLLTAADALLAAMHIRLEPADATAFQRSRSAVRAQLDTDTLKKAFGEGRKMTLEQAIEYMQAAEILPRESAASRTIRVAKQKFGGLTAREREVAALIAQGKSNREIADSLVLSERTVENHVGNILSKLDFHSRTQIAAWALERGLVGTKT